MGGAVGRHRPLNCAGRRRSWREALEGALGIGPATRPSREGGRRMKDLADLHVAAIESGQPEMFKKTIDSMVWRARLRQKRRREQETSTTSIYPRVDGGGGGRFQWFKGMGEPTPQGFLANPAIPEGFPFVIHGA